MSAFHLIVPHLVSLWNYSTVVHLDGREMKTESWELLPGMNAVFPLMSYGHLQGEVEGTLGFPLGCRVEVVDTQVECD